MDDNTPAQYGNQRNIPTETWTEILPSPCMQCNKSPLLTATATVQMEEKPIAKLFGRFLWGRWMIETCLSRCTFAECRSRCPAYNADQWVVLRALHPLDKFTPRPPLRSAGSNQNLLFYLVWGWRMTDIEACWCLTICNLIILSMIHLKPLHKHIT